MRLGYPPAQRKKRSTITGFNEAEAHAPRILSTSNRPWFSIN